MNATATTAATAAAKAAVGVAGLVGAAAAVVAFGPCPTEPHVNNAQTTITGDQDVVMATYHCLNGFQLSGFGRITCNKTIGLWPHAPFCSLIEHNTEINIYNNMNTSANNDNLYYFLGAIFGAMVLILGLLLLWYCCCVMQCCPTNTVKPTATQKPTAAISAMENQREPSKHRELKPAKDLTEGRIWMPHSNPVRNINTSTK